MKLLPTILVSSLFLFSCSDDDDSNGFQEGWNDQLVEQFALACNSEEVEETINEEEGIDVELDCDCVAKESAKFAPLSKFINDSFTQKEETEYGLILIRNCTK
ncbi:hypothetical protein [Aquimarina agarilytica]|uniref:hypothetical protein n=1 Tax=Aquimarina agarilytica TaxID=1087449 RepID=UPI00028A3EF2|nr:hypothetical protein [Aquimarina agarilytica]